MELYLCCVCQNIPQKACKPFHTNIHRYTAVSEQG